MMQEWTPEWFKQAACHGTSDPRFFGTIPEQKQVAKQYCTTCPVRVDCKVMANYNGDDMGVWGGIPGRVRKTHSRAK